MTAMLSPHFSRAEMTCRCGCGLVPTRAFVERLERIRALYERSLVVSSGARCASYNQRVSTTGADGPHVVAPDEGRIGAVDIAVHGSAAWKLLKVALMEGATGIGVKQRGSGRFIHLDFIERSSKHPRPWIWSYP